MTVNHTELIKDKLSILDVVGSYVTLEKAGKTWKGKSPFTNENTPSFFVSPDKGFFYCFSSGKGGDIFTFIQEIERVDFRGALTLLAERAGVSLDTTHHSDDKILYTLLDDATKWYEVQLRKNTKAVNYLLERGLKKETIVQFRLGYAEDAWSELYDYLSKKKKYSDKHIQEAGLITSKDGTRYYDRFRSRIMFPIMDSQGRVVGFSGRIFTEKEDDKSAKYVNSPEGPLFDKSKVLYGYHTAKSAISKSGSCIVVEGQFDVLMAQQSGSTHTVAVSGTGLTDDHLSLIHRFADTIHLCFDSDKAGIAATRRSVLKAYEHGVKVKVVTLPLGSDPADVIKNSTAQWEVYLKDAKDYLDYRLELFSLQYPEASFEDKHGLVTEDLFEFVASLKSSVVQDKVVQTLAHFLGVTPESLRTDFTRYQPPESSTTPVAQEEKRQEPAKEMSSLNEILGYYAFLKETYYEGDLTHVRSLFTEGYQKDIDTALDELTEPLKAMLLFKYEAELSELPQAKVYEHLLITLTHDLVRILKKRSDELLSKIRMSEQKKDTEGVHKLQQENMNIRQRIDTLLTY